MKSTITFLCAALFSTMSLAQVNVEENTETKTDTKEDWEPITLFGNKETSNGGFGALMVQYSELGKKEALFVGARGGWIMNHGFSIGLGGYGLTNGVYYTDNNGANKVQLEMGYGGLYFETTIASKWPVHVSFPVLVGAGGAAFTKNTTDSTDIWSSSTVVESDAFFVVEPGANLEFNITKFFRIAAGVSYRYVTGLGMSHNVQNDLNNLTGSVTLRFGKF